MHNLEDDNVIYCVKLHLYFVENHFFEHCFDKLNIWHTNEYILILFECIKLKVRNCNSSFVIQIFACLLDISDS